MNRFSRRDVVAGPTILDHIRDHLDPSGCGLLPGGDELPGVEAGDDEIRWAPGAFDGVGSRHFGVQQPGVTPDELIGMMGKTINKGFRPKEFGRLYERVRTLGVLSYIDPLLGAIRASALPGAGVHELGRRLATEGRHLEPVQLGIALLGLFEGGSDRDLLLTLGRHEELTLYSAVAIANTEADPEPVLWTLARSVGGWGRVQVVERLRETERDDIQEWIVREGFRNSVMNEYLAYIAATTGRLRDRLDGEPDDELLDAAGDIVSALIIGGPAESIDDYGQAPELIARILSLLDDRADRLTRFVVVEDIDGFLRREDGWDRRLSSGWTDELRQRLLETCERIKTREHWPSLAEAGLQSEEAVEFWAAERTAKALGIDTFTAHWRRLQADPLKGNWYAVMQLCDETRIETVIALAEQSLPLDRMARGPGRLLGVGPEFAAENALSFILQDLGRFPGRGWHLVSVGLRSPVVRVRNMAAKTLSEWPRDAWPENALHELTAAAECEPEERARERMNEILATQSSGRQR